MSSSIAWNNIDIVMFDMDGTLLDLAFDNYFWREAVPAAWADANQHPVDHAHSVLAPQFQQEEGTLNWYSLSFWSKTLGIDLETLKMRHRDRIALRDGVHETLDALDKAGKTLWLVTNAHPIVLDIKLDKANLAGRFEQIICSHDIGHAKEQAAFWPSLQQQYFFEPDATLLIDDSEPVLDAAKQFGLHVRGIAQPDSLLPPRFGLRHPALNHLTDLIKDMHSA
jgi:HAD superfamily hydrolase (TIGR01509 family)